jgi:hypothetical protein
MSEEISPKDMRLLRAIKIVKDLVRRSFYGKITVSIEAGNVVNVNVSESIKVDN